MRQSEQAGRDVTEQIRNGRADRFMNTDSVGRAARGLSRGHARDLYRAVGAKALIKEILPRDGKKEPLPAFASVPRRGRVGSRAAGDRAGPCAVAAGPAASAGRRFMSLVGRPAGWAPCRQSLQGPAPGPPPLSLRAHGSCRAVDG